MRWTLLTPKVISGSDAFPSTSENETLRSSAAMLGGSKTGAGLLNWLAEVLLAGDWLARLLAGLRAFGRGGGAACGDVVEADARPGMLRCSPFEEPLAPLAPAGRSLTPGESDSPVFSAAFLRSFFCTAIAIVSRGFPLRAPDAIGDER